MISSPGIERGIDLLAPAWHFLDLTPKDRGDWVASLAYETAKPAQVG
jgi:predicted dithiol-disulfide oxidoreductase (DUF899 family)